MAAPVTARPISFSPTPRYARAECEQKSGLAHGSLLLGDGRSSMRRAPIVIGPGPGVTRMKAHHDAAEIAHIPGVVAARR